MAATLSKCWGKHMGTKYFTAPQSASSNNIVVRSSLHTIKWKECHGCNSKSDAAKRAPKCDLTAFQTLLDKYRIRGTCFRKTRMLKACSVTGFSERKIMLMMFQSSLGSTSVVILFSFRRISWIRRWRGGRWSTARRTSSNDRVIVSTSARVGNRHRSTDQKPLWIFILRTP